MITRPTTVTLTKRAPDILIDKEKVIMGILAEANVRHSKALCPVLTGNLRDSIEVIRYGDHVLVGSELPYAGVVEYGTLTRTPVAYLRRGLQLAINEVRKKLRKS